jgi:hypothetical protein
MTLPRGRLRATAAALLASAAAAACTQASASDPSHVAVVVAGPAATNAAVVDRARAVVASIPGSQLRVPRTPTEQLAVTHLLAVQGYDAVVGVDLDRQIAVAPVEHRFPWVRFIATRPAALTAAVARAARCATCSGRRSARG